MRVAIIDYEAGNLTSVARAVRRLGHEAEVTADGARIAAADRVIFPGVGAAASCMTGLRARGQDRALMAAIASGRPVLGICVGMQLLFERSEEDGDTPCLGLLPGAVTRIRPADTACKVPHMGWNPVAMPLADPLFAGIPEDTCFYFVHSYACRPASGVAVIATTDHGEAICAGVRRDNLAAVQFHPEKSGDAGLQLLGNFLG
jgi:glutamine amidotransferase